MVFRLDVVVPHIFAGGQAPSMRTPADVRPPDSPAAATLPDTGPDNAIARTSTNAFDRRVLLLTCGVWITNYVMTGAMFRFIPGYPDDAATLLARAACCMLAASMCLALHRLLMRRPGSRHWLPLKTLLATIPAAVTLTFLGGAVFHGLTRYTQDPGQWMKPGMLAVDYVGYQWMFFTWGALYTSAAYAIEVQDRERQLAASQYAAQQAQLLTLRLQLNPHFLFNALNTLAGLVGMGRNAESEAMVLSLSRFLRHTLSRNPTQVTTLDDEIRMLDLYLDIEMARFSDRLRVVHAIDDDCHSARVPSLLLLPLVENAVKHGLRDSEDGITITIGARREAADLVLWVGDDGGPHAGPPPDGLGIGLSNVEQRLQALHGATAGLSIDASPSGWLCTIRLPCQVET